MTTNPSAEQTLTHFPDVDLHYVSDVLICDRCRGTGQFGDKVKWNCGMCEGYGGWLKGFYFYDETGMHLMGPYDSEVQAVNQRSAYAAQL